MPAEAVAGRRRALTAVVMLVIIVAEAKLAYYSYSRRDLAHTVQGLLLA